LKVDAEGGDLDVLRGYFVNGRPLPKATMFEWERGSLGEPLDLLRQAGYRHFRFICRWNEEPDVTRQPRLAVFDGHDPMVDDATAVLEGAETLLATGAIDRIQFEFGGTALDSRIFLRDIIRYLAPSYTVSRILRDGVVDVIDDEAEEIFHVCQLFSVTQRMTRDRKPRSAPADGQIRVTLRFKACAHVSP
jgi:hypothetical protein